MTEAAPFAAFELVGPRFFRFVFVGGRLVLLKCDAAVLDPLDLEAVLPVQGGDLETNQSAGWNLDGAGGEFVLLGGHLDFLYVLRRLRRQKTSGAESYE